MSWVDVPEAKLWIRQHALRTTHSKITNDGRYDEGNTQNEPKLKVFLFADYCTAEIGDALGNIL